MFLVACDGNGSSSSSTSSGGNGGNGGSGASGTTASAGGSGGASTGGGGSASTTGGGGSGGAGGTTGSGMTTGATTGTGGTGDCAPCDWSCCGTQCTNLTNDILNCGSCGNVCPGPNPFCSNGTCGEPPCNGQLCGATGLCCGAACCKPGELCCNVPGPVESGPICTPPTEGGTCPLGCQSCVCASPDTAVATPGGERLIADLQVGDLVYSVHQGRVVAVPIAEAVHVPAPEHFVVRVKLDNGRTVVMSPKHPTADGRTFADLRAGETLGGARVESAETEAFRFQETVDILPASDTGAYFAAGVLVGSTLAPSAPQHCGQVAPPSD